MDIVNVDATGSTLQEDVTLTSSLLTGLEMPDGITYRNLAALDVSLGGGGDNVNILGTGPGSTQINAGAGTNSFDIQATAGNLLVSGGAGSDAFVVGGTSAAAARATSAIKGALMLEGGAGTNSIAVTADVNFTLTDQSLQLSNGELIGLSGIQQAILTGGTTDNTFDVSGWTGSATLTGGGGLDTIVSTVDASALLTNALFTRSNGASFVLSGIASAILSGGAGNETLDATGFSGTAWLYGGSGADTLLAGSGNDYLDGGTGNDSLVGGAGIDILNGATGAGDTLMAGLGDTTIYGSPFADVIDAAAGNDLIYGDGGSDNITGGAGNDTIVGGTGAATIFGGTGSDLIFDGGAGVIHADGPGGGTATAVDTIYGSGHDDIFAGAGNDIIYNQGGTNTITGATAGTQVYNVAAGTVALPSPGTIPTPPDWPPPAVQSAATLPSGATAPGRWTGLSGSALAGGLSNSPAQAVESSVVAGAGGEYVAWSDSRDGQYEIYVAEHTSSGWVQLSGSAQGGGISDTSGAARRPSITLNAAGEPVVAYTVFNGTSSDIDVAEYDPTANSGAGGWVALGSSLGSGGISGTGAADDASITETSSGPVVAWLNTSSGIANVFVKQFTGGNWVTLGTGGASGTGVSGSSTSVSDLALTSSGANVALAWTQTVNATQQIYLLEYTGGTWQQLRGSASTNGISNSTAQATSPSLAFDNGTLFAAWQDNSSGLDQIYAAMYSGGSWSPAGGGATSSGGISASRGPATAPVLSSNDGQLYLAWIDNEFPSAPANGAAVYVKSWNGSAFAAQLPGDANFGGITGGLGIVQSPSLAVDPSGHPFVSFSELDSGSSQIVVLGNTFALGTIHYVNDSGTDGDIYTTALGNDANSGLSPGSPMLTIQAVLSDTAHPLKPGDVILVDNGTYSGAVNLSSIPSNVLILGSPTGSTTISGPITGTGVSGTVLEDLDLTGGVTFTAATNAALYRDVISGSGVTLSGGSGLELLNDNITTSSTGVTVQGGATQVSIDDDSISSSVADISIATGGATGLDVRGNQLTGGGTGIALAAAAAGTIGGNQITAGAMGISIAAAFTGAIASNDIDDAAVGVSYQAAAALADNRIHDDGTGVESTVLDPTNGFGFVGTTVPNQIFDNQTGVNLVDANMQNQDVYDNALGVSGTGFLGGRNPDDPNVLAANTVTVTFNGPIEYNQITREDIGIIARSGQLIAYNTFYDNTQSGVSVTGQTAVSIVNNTFFAPTGDNVDVTGGSTQTEILNNIFWAESGYDINVANDSQTGYFSDYNDLYSSGAGKLVHWDIDFTDVLDWQDDVDDFDLHSEGTTALNPTLNQPRFAGLSINDFQVNSLFAALRSSCPTINAADPITDEALPAVYQNLLTNPDFSLGSYRLDGKLPSGGTQSANPAPWTGNDYFFAGPNAVVTLDQTVNRPAPGLTDAEIDSGDETLIFGGRDRSANETPADAGSISVTFFDASGNVISTAIEDAQNLSTRWELVGGTASTFPSEPRSALHRFTAVRNSGSGRPTTPTSMRAFVYVQSDSAALDQGAYGAGRVQSGATQTPTLRLISPDLYTDWLDTVQEPIRWESLGNTTNAPVRIDLYQDGPNGPQFLLNITPSTPDTGVYQWIAADSGINFGTHGLRIQISLVGSPSVFDRSTEDLTVPDNTTTYYVNDSGTFGDIYTSAPGSNRNDGTNPSEPVPYINNILRMFTLGPGDTIDVDAGNYGLLSPLVVSGTAGSGNDSGFTITGPNSTGLPATFTLANPLTDAPVITLNDASFMMVENLTLSGGSNGLLAEDNSTNLVATNLTFSHNSSDGLLVENSPAVTLENDQALDNGGAGIRILSGSNVLAMNSITATGNSSYGIYVDSSIPLVLDCTATYNGGDGINLADANDTLVESCTSSDNAGTGIVVNQSGSTQSVVGDLDLTQGLGNIVANNSADGISVNGNVLVAGNAVSGSTGSQSAGVYLDDGALAANNDVYGNASGIVTVNGNSAVYANRIYDNSGDGISIYQRRRPSTTT